MIRFIRRWKWTVTAVLIVLAWIALVLARFLLRLPVPWWLR